MFVAALGCVWPRGMARTYFLFLDQVHLQMGDGYALELLEKTAEASFVLAELFLARVSRVLSFYFLLSCLEFMKTNLQIVSTSNESSTPTSSTNRTSSFLPFLCSLASHRQHTNISITIRSKAPIGRSHTRSSLPLFASSAYQSSDLHEHGTLLSSHPKIARK